MDKSNLVAQLYTVREFCKTPEDIKCSIEKVAKIGYGGVQVSAIGKIDPAELRKICDDNGVSIVATHTPLPDFVGDIDKVIETHQIYGCAYPGIGSMPRAYYPLTVEGFTAFGQKAGEIAGRLEKENMKLVYHNHSFELQRFGKITGHDLIFQSTSPSLQAEIDIFWITAGGGDPAAWIRKYSGRIDLLHLKDYGVNPKGERLMKEVGEGNLNWPEIMKACAEAGVRYYIVEQDNCNGRDPFDSLAISFNNLKEMLGV